MKNVFRNRNLINLFTLTLLVILSIASLGMSDVGELVSMGSTLVDGPAAPAFTTTRVSVSSTGVQGNLVSLYPAISADGRYVAFLSSATNLVSGDTNNHTDVFVHDMKTGETTRVSVASDGSQANFFSSVPSISADGRYVAFGSSATNLVNGDTNGEADVFVHDRQTGETTRVSVASDGSQSQWGGGLPSISADGRYVAFVSLAHDLVSGDTNNLEDVFVHDRQTHTTTRVSVASDGTQGNESSDWPSISADGRYVAFSSLASNLVSGDTNECKDPGGLVELKNGQCPDIFVHDRVTGTTTRVSVASDGTQGNNRSGFPAISSDGKFVAFLSFATTLVHGDTNGRADIFVRNLKTNTTTRVSVTSSDGTQGNGSSRAPTISSDGRYIAFLSYASNLVTGDTNGMRDVFIHNTQTGVTTRVSVASSGAQGNGDSRSPSISANGRYTAFDSWASNLVSGDTNGILDVFVHDRGSSVTPRLLSPSGPIGDTTPTYKWATVGWYTKYKLAVYSLNPLSRVVLQEVPASRCAASSR
jgi:Tol biopolymer transport system component